MEGGDEAQDEVLNGALEEVLLLIQARVKHGSICDSHPCVVQLRCINSDEDSQSCPRRVHGACMKIRGARHSYPMAKLWTVHDMNRIEVCHSHGRSFRRHSDEQLGPVRREVEPINFLKDQICAQYLSITKSPPKGEHPNMTDQIASFTATEALSQRRLLDPKEKVEGKKGKVIVTGGSGKLGRWVVREMVDHGYEVYNGAVDSGPTQQVKLIRFS